MSSQCGQSGGAPAVTARVEMEAMGCGDSGERILIGVDEKQVCELSAL
jgi:hypothetical protein